MEICTSILLVGKPGHVRDALAGLIQSLPDTTRLWYASDCRQAQDLAREDQPDIILLTGAPFGLETVDSSAVMDPADFDALRQIAPLARCLVLTESPDPRGEARFSAADVVLSIGAPFDRLRTTIQGLINRG